MPRHRMTGLAAAGAAAALTLAACGGGGGGGSSSAGFNAALTGVVSPSGHKSTGTLSFGLSR